MFWAPLSELYGRQILFIISFGGLTAFNAGLVGASNMWTMIILRFLAGSFGSSPLTNAGGVIADMYTSTDRGVPMAVFGSAPFLGPVSLPWTLLSAGHCIDNSSCLAPSLAAFQVKLWVGAGPWA